MRFLIDINLNPRWTPALTAAGHEAVDSDVTICE
jgi:predicted nuclease of predicted toxin-antitoxin system